MNKNNSARLYMILAMTIFGTIGIFRKYIQLSSTWVALMRGLLGVSFLVFYTKVRRIRLNKDAIKKHIGILVFSGVLIGINWAMLFESYQYTTVAVATLCYYMAPVFVILASPIVLKERLTARKIICVVMALAGMVFVSGVLEESSVGQAQIKGIIFGLGAAVLYAMVVILNQRLKTVPTYDKTMVQLGSASFILLIYVMLAEGLPEVTITSQTVILLLVVGIVHTGIAYALYFGSMNSLKAQTVALLAYIDPIVALILSVVLLKEHMSLLSGIGAVLVLASTLISELPEKRRQ